MIQAIKEIGTYVRNNNRLQEEDILESICLDVPEKSEKDEKTLYTIILNFKTEAKRIEIELQETNCKETNGDSGKAYLWVDNFKGNKPPLNVTSDKLDSILSKTLPSLKEKIHDQRLSNEIEKVINIFFNKKEYKEEGSKKGVSYYIKPEYLGLKEEDLRKLKELENKVNSASGKDGTKKALKDLLKETIKLVLSTKNKTTKDINLYTVKINDRLICQEKEYKKVIAHAKIENLFSSDGDYANNLQRGYCSVCGMNDTITTSNATNLKFKFYMTDKIGFSSNLDGRFTKNYNICRNCYIDLMITEKFLNEQGKSYIGNLPAYIIPHFIDQPSNLRIDKFFELLKSKTDSISTIDSLKEFQHNLERFREFEEIKSRFVINYLFYQPSARSDFKILKLIKDVPPSRLDELTEEENKISKLVDDKYNGDKNLKVDMKQIWFSIPIREDKKGGKKAGYSRYLDILDAIFSKEKIDYNFLVNQFIEVIRIIYYEREGYNIWTKQSFVNKILQMNFLFLFLNEIGCLEGLNMTEVKSVNGQRVCGLIPKEIQEYWGDVGIYKDDSKKGLFLLGYLIGEIGKAQNKDTDRKPILNKITFQGMSKEKLLRLINEICEKLSQYKLLKYNENLFSACHLLLEENIDNWRLSDQENVFYILSGFAFSNYLGYSRWATHLSEELARKAAAITEVEGNGKDVKNLKELLEESKKQLAEKEYKELSETFKKIDEIIEEVKAK